MKYNNYAEKIVPVMLQHHLIEDDETELMKQFIRENMGDDFA